MSSVIKRNNVRVMGKGEQVVLFAHGFGCDQNSWKFIVNSFLDDYKVILFDYVGAGKSDLTAYDPFKYGNLEGYATDILDICGEMNLSDVVFIGHSVSSMIGLLAAIKEPAYFKKLIFIGPSPKYINDGNYVGGFDRDDLDALFESMDSNYLGWSSTIAPAIMANPDRPELGSFLTDSFCATEPDIAKNFARVTFFSDNRSDLKKLTVESVTLQCSEDIIAPYQVGNYIKENTPGNTMHLLKATGHCPHISEPQEVIHFIKASI